jgi:hypothetical protein
MSEENDVYTSSVLTDVIDKYAIQAISATRQGLHFAETNRDQIVWEIATKIYSQSGHKVSLIQVRDIIDSSIKTIREKLDIEERERIAHEAAEMEAQKVARLEAERIAVEAENRRRKLLEESVEILRKLAPELLGDEKNLKFF